MKWIIIAISIIVSLAACSRSSLVSKPEPELGKPFTIKYRQTVTLQDSHITVQFKQLLGDSRCPKGVECVWAGNAQIQVFFNHKPVKLNTNPGVKNGNTVVISDYKVKLISLSPYPDINKPVKKKNYVAKLLVTRMGK